MFLGPRPAVSGRVVISSGRGEREQFTPTPYVVVERDNHAPLSRPRSRYMIPCSSRQTGSRLELLTRAPARLGASRSEALDAIQIPGAEGFALRTTACASSKEGQHPFDYCSHGELLGCGHERPKPYRRASSTSWPTSSTTWPAQTSLQRGWLEAACAGVGHGDGDGTRRAPLAGARRGNPGLRIRSARSCCAPHAYLRSGEDRGRHSRPRWRSPLQSFQDGPPQPEITHSAFEEQRATTGRTCANGSLLAGAVRLLSGGLGPKIARARRRVVRSLHGRSGSTRREDGATFFPRKEGAAIRIRPFCFMGGGGVVFAGEETAPAAPAPGETRP